MACPFSSPACRRELADLSRLIPSVIQLENDDGPFSEQDFMMFLVSKKPDTAWACVLLLLNDWHAAYSPEIYQSRLECIRRRCPLYMELAEQMCGTGIYLPVSLPASLSDLSIKSVESLRHEPLEEFRQFLYQRLSNEQSPTTQPPPDWIFEPWSFPDPTPPHPPPPRPFARVFVSVTSRVNSSIFTEVKDGQGLDSLMDLLSSSTTTKHTSTSVQTPDEKTLSRLLHTRLMSETSATSSSSSRYLPVRKTLSSPETLEAFEKACDTLSSAIPPTKSRKRSAHSHHITSRKHKTGPPSPEPVYLLDVGNVLGD